MGCRAAQHCAPASATMLVLVLTAQSAARASPSAARAASMPPFGTPWFASTSNKVNLTVAENSTGSVLRWTKPDHFSAIFGYLPAAIKLDKDGAKVNVSMRWRSSGDDVCTDRCAPNNCTRHSPLPWGQKSKRRVGRVLSCPSQPAASPTERTAKAKSARRRSASPSPSPASPGPATFVSRCSTPPTPPGT